MNAAREAWFEGQIDLDPTQIVFIDETPPTPRWRAFTVARPEASDAAPPCLMATGKPPTFTAALRYDGIAALMVLVGDHGDWSDGWMQVEIALAPVSLENVGAGVVPDVGPISAKPAELNVVAISFLAVAKHENQFMP